MLIVYDTAIEFLHSAVCRNKTRMRTYFSNVKFQNTFKKIHLLKLRVSTSVNFSRSFVSSIDRGVHRVLTVPGQEFSKGSEVVCRCSDLLKKKAQNLIAKKLISKKGL